MSESTSVVDETTAELQHRNEHLSKAIRRALTCEAEEQRAAFGVLCGLILPWVDSAMQRVLQRCGDDQVARDDVALSIDFIEHLSKTPEKLEKILAADKPLGYLTMMASNYAWDVVGGSSTVGAPSARPVEEATGIPDPDALDPETQLVFRDQQDALAEHVARIQQLPLDDRLLLRVVLHGVLEISQDELTHLAESRGVSAERLREELKTRYAVQEQATAQAREKLAKRLSVHESRLRRQRQLFQICEELGDNSAVAEPDPQLPDFSGTPSAKQLRMLTPGQRVHFALYLSELCERSARLVLEARHNLARVLPAGPRYEEVAMILGRISGPHDPARGRVVNTITKRFHRLIEKLNWRAICSVTSAPSWTSDETESGEVPS